MDLPEICFYSICYNAAFEANRPIFFLLCFCTDSLNQFL